MSTRDGGRCDVAPHLIARGTARHGTARHGTNSLPAPAMTWAFDDNPFGLVP